MYWFDVVIHYGSNRTIVFDESYFTGYLTFDRVGHSFEHVSVDVAIFRKSNEDKYVCVGVIVVLINELMIGSGECRLWDIAVYETVYAFEVTDFYASVWIFFLEVFHREREVVIEHVWVVIEDY